MTKITKEEEIKYLQAGIEDLRRGIEANVTPQVLDLINQLVEAEVKLESYCNQ